MAQIHPAAHLRVLRGLFAADADRGGGEADGEREEGVEGSISFRMSVSVSVSVSGEMDGVGASGMRNGGIGTDLEKR